MQAEQINAVIICRVRVPLKLFV